MKLPARGAYRLRTGRVSMPGGVYFITKAARDRLPDGDPFERGVLMSEGAADCVVETFRWVQRTQRGRILSFAVMPDHFHLLLVLGQTHTLDQVLQSTCGFTARAINASLERRGELWQTAISTTLYAPAKTSHRYTSILSIIRSQPAMCRRLKNGPGSTPQPCSIHAATDALQQPTTRRERDMSNLESDFKWEMIKTLNESTKLGYNPTLVRQWIGELGGVGAARKVINIKDTSSGFTTLWILKRLDLSIEALVLKPAFKTLFTEEERALARASLKEYTYVAPWDIAE